jgi:hypothetical protein
VLLLAVLLLAVLLLAVLLLAVSFLLVYTSHPPIDRGLGLGYQVDALCWYIQAILLLTMYNMYEY